MGKFHRICDAILYRTLSTMLSIRTLGIFFIASLVLGFLGFTWQNMIMMLSSIVGLTFFGMMLSFVTMIFYHSEFREQQSIIEKLQGINKGYSGLLDSCQRFLERSDRFAADFVKLLSLLPKIDPEARSAVINNSIEVSKARAVFEQELKLVLETVSTTSKK